MATEEHSRIFNVPTGAKGDDKGKTSSRILEKRYIQQYSRTRKRGWGGGSTSYPYIDEQNSKK